VGLSTEKQENEDDDQHEAAPAVVIRISAGLAAGMAVVAAPAQQ
jgi:hypothetical protein